MAQRKSPATIRDVAKEAGVSYQTVSRVLNANPSSLPISDETRARVLKAVEELGYRPNLMARAFRTPSSPEQYIEELEWNPDTLYILGRLYVALLTLVKVGQGDPEFRGLTSVSTLRRKILETLRELPIESQSLFNEEVSKIESLIGQGNYAQALDYVRMMKGLIEKRIRHIPPQQKRSIFR